MTGISWTDETWNPVVGCTKVSPGCQHCYAENLHTMRHKAFHAGKALPVQYAKPFSEVQCLPDRLDIPLHWWKPRRVFVNSMSDLFHEDVPDWFIDRVFGVMAEATQHTFQVLTKRPERMLRWTLDAYGNHPLYNVWKGVTAEDQQRAYERIPLLLQTPAAVRFVSVEPMLGPVNLCPWLILPRDPESIDEAEQHGTTVYDPSEIHWIICGGESGPKARPMHPDWARSLRDQCQAAKVPFHFKQMSGRTAIPEDLMIREFPV